MSINPSLSWTSGDGTKLVYSDMPVSVHEEQVEEMVVEEEVVGMTICFSLVYNINAFC